MQLKKKGGVVFTGFALLFCCLVLPFHNDDAALYAHIAQRMVESGDWVSVVVDGEPWLDKAHLHFWIHAVFFALFGKAEWVFRLPLLLAVLGSAYYLYMLIQQDAKRSVGRTAVWMLSAVLYLPLVLLEGRAESYAMLAVVGGIFHLQRWGEHQGVRDAVGSSLFMALGMMTKGLYVPLLIGGTMGLVTMARGKFTIFWHWHTLLVIGFFVVLLVPEVMALRLQFGDGQ